MSMYGSQYLHNRVSQDCTLLSIVEFRFVAILIRNASHWCNKFQYVLSLFKASAAHRSFSIQYSPVNSHTKYAEIFRTSELPEPTFTSTLSTVASCVQNNRANYPEGVNQQGSNYPGLYCIQCTCMYLEKFKR